MAATATTYLVLHDGDHCRVEPTADGMIRLSHDVGSVRFSPQLARTVAAHLLAAAEHVDPDPVDTDAIARTLAIATGGAA